MRYEENYPQFCEFEDVDKFLKDVEAYKVTELVEWWQGYLDGDF